MLISIITHTNPAIVDCIVWLIPIIAMNIDPIRNYDDISGLL